MLIVNILAISAVNYLFARQFPLIELCKKEYPLSDY